MSGDAREVLIQLAMGALAAVVVAFLLPRMGRVARAAKASAAVLVGTAIVALGILEARVFAAVLAGSAIGALASTLIRTRPTLRTRLARLLAATAAAFAPLVILEWPTSGESVMHLTRVASETSGGSWAVAWLTSWHLLFDPVHGPERVLLAAAWMLLLATVVTALTLAHRAQGERRAASAERPASASAAT